MPKIRRNLKNVIKFELIRNLKKPTFWIAALILPVLLIGYIALAGLVGYNTSASIEDSATDTSELSLGIFDESSYLTTTEIADADGNIQTLTTFDSKEQGIESVKNDTINVFYYVPANFAETLTIETYAKSEDVSIFTSYDAPIRTLLAITAAGNVAPEDFAVISGTITVNTTNFDIDNTEVDPMAAVAKMVIPMIALAIFYVLICLFGNRLTTAMTEEKENRISEMILTSMSPKDLITGKIISLIILGFIQLLALIIPIIILAAFGFANNIIPADFPIDFSPYLIISSLALLVISYFLFTGLCVTISTFAPTAKDANNFSAPIIILTILPLFFVNSFLSAEAATPITYILSYFPPSAPIALMFRNAFGTLPPWELLIGLIEMAICSFLIIKLAVFIYVRSALEFTSKIDLKKLLTNPRKSWSATNEKE